MHQPVETVRRLGGRRVHRFQVVRERRAAEGPEDWVVVDFTEGGVRLATPDFEWRREVPDDALAGDRFEPLVAGDIPVWGY